MTSPDTTAVRAWARENGYDVAGRGRLPADVVAAYEKAEGRSGATPAKKAAKAAPAKKAAVKKAPAKKAAAQRAPAKKAATAPAARKAAATKATGPAAAPATETAVAAAPSKAAAQAAERPAPTPKPSVVSDDRRLVALGEQLKALTDRVAKLEKAAGSDKGSSGAKSRFRRR